MESLTVQGSGYRVRRSLRAMVLVGRFRQLWLNLILLSP